LLSFFRMLIYLCRHAQQDVGEADSDIGITSLGEEQSRALGKFLRKKGSQILLSSNLPRALGTAKIVGEVINLEPKVSPLLREIETPKGAWSEYVKTRHPEFGYHPGGGESVNDLIARARKGWRWILKEADGRDAVVICHSIFIKSLLYTLGFEEHLIRNDAVANTGVVILEAEKEAIRLVKFNYYRHLIPLRIRELGNIFS